MAAKVEHPRLLFAALITSAVTDENDAGIVNAQEAVGTLDAVGVHPIDIWPIREFRPPQALLLN